MSGTVFPEQLAEYLSTMHHLTPDELICYLSYQTAEKHSKDIQEFVLKAINDIKKG